MSDTIRDLFGTLIHEAASSFGEEVGKSVKDFGKEFGTAAAKELVTELKGKHPSDASASPPATAVKAWLSIVEGNRERARVPLTGAHMILGRRVLGDQDPRMSRDHAAFYLNDGRFWVEDKNSTNGTYVNRQRVMKQVLAPGDWIQLGATMLQFQQQ